MRAGMIRPVVQMTAAKGGEATVNDQPIVYFLVDNRAFGHSQNSGVHADANNLFHGRSPSFDV